jgi:hypothetical protein
MLCSVGIGSIQYNECELEHRALADKLMAVVRKPRLFNCVNINRRHYPRGISDLVLAEVGATITVCCD